MARTLANFWVKKTKTTFWEGRVQGEEEEGERQTRKKIVGQPISSIFCVKASQAEGDAFTQKTWRVRAFGVSTDFHVEHRRGLGFQASGFWSIGFQGSGFKGWENRVRRRTE